MPDPEKATLACGCFWGVQARFDALTGVTSTIVGYTGGQSTNPNYEQVCCGNTGHAEAIEVYFDPNIITYTTLLTLFFQIHDPTSYHQQGPDIGSQYRSAIFYHSEEQKNCAIELVNQIRPSYSHQIVTELNPASKFYDAEDYHQHYFKKHPNACC